MTDRISHVLPLAAAIRLVDEQGHFPQDLVQRGLEDPNYALHVSRALQGIENWLAMSGATDEGSKVDFIQQEWERECLDRYKATADTDGRQDYWSDSTAAVADYQDLWKNDDVAQAKAAFQLALVWWAMLAAIGSMR